MEKLILWQAACGLEECGASEREGGVEGGGGRALWGRCDESAGVNQNKKSWTRQKVEGLYGKKPERKQRGR